MRLRGLDAATWLALAATVVVLFWLSFAELLHGEDPARHAGVGDTAAYLGPTQFFLDRAIAEGDLPLWNPHLYSGSPFAAHPVSMAFYPPNLARSLLAPGRTPRDTLLSIYGLALFHLLLLSFGLYALARREGLRRDTSFLVAVAVTISFRWLVFAVENVALLSGAAWTPVVLLCLNRGVAGRAWRERFGWLLLGGLAYGLQMLAGFFQAAIYAAFAYAAYVAVPVLARLWDERPSAAEAARTAVTWALGLALFGVTGALVAAAILWPSAELLAASARGAENYARYGTGKETVNLSTWSWIAGMVEASGPGFLAARKAVAAGVGWLLSLGMAFMAAAAAAAFSTRTRSVLVYAVLLAVLVDLVMGPPMPLAWLFDVALPVETSSSFYSAVLCSIPLGLLAGFGIEALFDPGSRAAPLLRSVVVGATALVLIALLEDPALTRIDPGLVRFAGPAAATLALVVAAWRPRPSLRWALLLALGFEVATAGPAVIADTFRHPFQFRGRAEDLDQDPEGSSPARVLAAGYGNTHLWSLRSAIDGYEPLVLPWAIELLSNAGEESSYTRTVHMRGNPSAAALMRRRFWLVPAVVEGPPPPKTRLFPPTRAVFLADASDVALPRIELGDLPDSALASPGREVVLWEAGRRGKPMPPRLETALGATSRSLLIDYRASQEARLAVSITGTRPSEDFGLGTGEGLPLRPGRHVLELPLPMFERATLGIRPAGRAPGLRILRVRTVEDAADEWERLEIDELSPDRVRVALRELPGPRALVFAEAWFPGWSASLDGEAAPILPAYGALQAVRVPPGSHVVEFAFRPSRVPQGLWVSGLASALALASVAWTLRPLSRPRE